jgi:hypothetical protein
MRRIRSGVVREMGGGKEVDSDEGDVDVAEGEVLEVVEDEVERRTAGRGGEGRPAGDEIFEGGAEEREGLDPLGGAPLVVLQRGRRVSKSTRSDSSRR